MLQTSNTVSWSLYHMALEPEIQEKLYQEVISVCPGDKVPTSDDIARIPWLKTVVRETLRYVISHLSSPLRSFSVDSLINKMKNGLLKLLYS